MTRRVAILGAGIGAEHLTGYLALSNRYDVAIICDLDADRAAPLIGRTPNAKHSTEISDVLSDPTIDIVDICLPPDLHLPVATAALDAGKHVICEKPLVPNLNDLEVLKAKVAVTGKRVFPVFQYRFGLAANQLRALQEGGIAGTPFIGTLETHWSRDADYYAIGWRGTWAGEKGGAIVTHAIHIHDWLAMTLGPVASVQADLATRVNDIEVEDCAALSIRMVSGALVTSSVTLGAANDSTRLRFCFQGLTAESARNPYRPADGNWTFTARPPIRQSDIDSILDDIEEHHSGFAGFLTAVADNLDGQPNEAVTLADAEQSLEFASAVYLSARTGKRVSLPVPPAHPIRDGWAPI